MSLWRTLGGFINFFPWTVYTHDYYKQVTNRDFLTQMILSLVGATLSIWLISESLEVAISTPLVASVNELSPSPERIAELFVLQSEGSVLGLTCPCVSSFTKFGEVANVTWQNDNFCDSLINDSREFDPPFISQAFSNLRPISSSTLRRSLGQDWFGDDTGLNLNPKILEAPSCFDFTLSSSANIAKNLSAIFNSSTEWILAENENGASFLDYFEQSVCASVFGLSRTDRRDTPVPPPTDATFGESLCTTQNLRTFLDPSFLGNCNLRGLNYDFSVPPILRPASSSSFQVWTQLYNSRFLDLLSSSTYTCDFLRATSERFLNDVIELPVDIRAALSDNQINFLLRQVFNQTLASRATLAARSIEPLGDIDRFPLILPFNGAPFGRGIQSIEDSSLFIRNLPGIIPPVQLSIADTVLSSSLPFVRTDTFIGAQQFYLHDFPQRNGISSQDFMSRSPSSTPYLFNENETEGSLPLFFGLYQLYTTGEPYSQQINTGTFSGRAYADSIFSRDSSFPENNRIPFSNDLLQLIDACIDEKPLLLEIYSIDPLVLTPNLRNSSKFRWPWHEFWPNITMPESNYCNSVTPQFCQKAGTYRSSLNADGIMSSPLMTISLNCPQSVIYLGRLRRNSSYYNLTSNYRRTWGDLFAMFPQYPKGSNTPFTPSSIYFPNPFPPFATLLYSCAWFSTSNVWKDFIQRRITNLTAIHSTFTPEQISFCSTFLLPDQQDRLNVYSNLMLDSRGPTFTTNVRAHYEFCRPAGCTYTLVRSRTTVELGLEAVSIYGGNVSAILSLLSFLAYSLSAFYFYTEQRIKKLKAHYPNPPPVLVWGELKNPVAIELPAFSNQKSRVCSDT